MSIAQNIENFTTQNSNTIPWTLGPKIPIFEVGIHAILPKTEHYQAQSLFFL